MCKRSNDFLLHLKMSYSRDTPRIYLLYILGRFGWQNFEFLWSFLMVAVVELSVR